MGAEGVTNHEGMRLLILSRFEDDALLRQEVEVWLDEVSAPGEQVLCECAELGLCHCFCEKCSGCGKVGTPGNAGEDDSEEEAVGIEVVPGIRVLAKFLKGKKG